jgi:hypothetical protein
MTTQNKNIALLEKLLLHLKNAKLEYLKASDRENSPDLKRYFNLIATQRNRFFQQVLSVIQSYNISYDDLIVGRFNYDQLLISSISIKKSSLFEKCIKSDQILLDIYKSLLDINELNKVLLEQKNKVTKTLENNQSLRTLKNSAKKHKI